MSTINYYTNLRFTQMYYSFDNFAQRYNEQSKNCKFNVAASVFTFHLEALQK